MDLKELRKNKYVQISAVIILLVLSLVVNKYFTMFIIITGFTGLFTYYEKLYHIPFSTSPMFMLGFAITRFYGLKWTALFIFLGYIVPKLIAGSGMKMDSYLFLVIGFGINASSLLLGNMNFVLMGFIMSFVQFVAGIQVSMIFGKQFMFAVGDGFFDFVKNCLYFYTFGSLIVWIMSIF